MKKKETEALEEEIEIPEGIEVKVEGSKIIIKKEGNVLERDFSTKKIVYNVQDNKLKFSASRSTRREKKLLGSIMAHVKNMLRGISKNHVYKLQICSGHFPMNVSVSGNEFVIKNFLGETIPRTLKIREGVSVKVDGSNVIVESNNKELAGQTAASIEQLTRVKARDSRIFQDGIYIIEKDGKPI